MRSQQLVNLVALVVVWASASAAAAQVTVDISAPVADARFVDSVPFSVSISSLYEVTQVRAEVGDAQASWTHSIVGGSVPVGDEPSGMTTLTITATDTFGTSGSASVPVRIDRPPVVTFLAPQLLESTATTSLSISVRCMDDDPAGCASLTVAPFGLTGTSAIEEEVSLGSVEDGGVELVAVGTDSAGRQVTATRRVLVPNNPKLMEVLRSEHGKIIDTDGSRVLVLGDGSTTAYIETASASTEIFDDPQHPLTRGALVDDGAVLGDGHEVWRWNGALTHLDGALLYSAAGHWLMLKKVVREQPSRQLAFVILDLDTEQQVFSTESLGSGTQDEFYFGSFWIHESGVATWQGQPEGSGVYRYRDGNVDPITAPAARVRQGLKTDGTNITYSVPSSGYAESYVITAGGAVRVCYVNDPLQCSPAILNNGWAAYAKTKDTNTMRVFRRSPDGTETQVSVFAADTRARGVSPDGQVAMESGGRLYLTDDGPMPTDLGVVSGTLYWKGHWYVAQGPSLFRIYEDGAPAADAGVEPGDAGVGDDGGAAGGLDAGTEEDAGASTGEEDDAGEADVEEEDDAGAGNEAEEDGGATFGGVDAGAPHKRRGDDGCSLSPSRTGAGSAAWLLCLAIVLMLRRAAPASATGSARTAPSRWSWRLRSRRP